MVSIGSAVNPHILNGTVIAPPGIHIRDGIFFYGSCSVRTVRVFLPNCKVLSSVYGMFTIVTGPGRCIYSVGSDYDYQLSACAGNFCGIYGICVFKNGQLAVIFYSARFTQLHKIVNVLFIFFACTGNCCVADVLRLYSFGASCMIALSRRKVMLPRNAGESRMRQNKCIRRSYISGVKEPMLLRGTGIMIVYKSYGILCTALQKTCRICKQTVVFVRNISSRRIICIPGAENRVHNSFERKIECAGACTAVHFRALNPVLYRIAPCVWI